MAAEGRTAVGPTPSAKASGGPVSDRRRPLGADGLVEHSTDIYETADGRGGVDEIVLPAAGHRRLCPLVLHRAWHRQRLCAPFDYYTLREFEVYGTGGPVLATRPLPPPADDGTWDLSGGWKLYSESFVHDDAGKVSTCGYDDSRWLPAVVPGTVLTSYLAAGAIPDMFYGDHQFQVSDWFCHCDWWYRVEMELPRIIAASGCGSASTASTTRPTSL